MKKSSLHTFIGVVLLVVGSLILVNNLGLGDAFGGIFRQLWPITFFILGGVFMSRNRPRTGGFFILVGVILLLSQIFNISFWKLFWPLLIIWLGLSLLISRPNRKTTSAETASSSTEIKEEAIFWAVKKKMTGKDFQGGEITAIFGGVELDLRDVEIPSEGATLKITAIFGGIEIKVSRDRYQVVTKGEGIAGGWDEPFRNNAPTEKPILIIQGSAIFGGISITN